MAGKPPAFQNPTWMGGPKPSKVARGAEGANQRRQQAAQSAKDKRTTPRASESTLIRLASRIADVESSPLAKGTGEKKRASQALSKAVAGYSKKDLQHALDNAGIVDKRIRKTLIRHIKPAEEDDGGLLGVDLGPIDDVLGTVVDVLDLPGRYVRSNLAGTISGISDVIQGKGDLQDIASTVLAPFSALGVPTGYINPEGRNAFAQHKYTGELLQDSLKDLHVKGTPLNDPWVQMGLGLVGDIATDPITYASFGMTAAGKAAARDLPVLLERIRAGTAAVDNAATAAKATARLKKLEAMAARGPKTAALVNARREKNVATLAEDIARHGTRNLTKFERAVIKGEMGAGKMLRHARGAPGGVKLFGKTLEVPEAVPVLGGRPVSWTKPMETLNHALWPKILAKEGHTPEALTALAKGAKVTGEVLPEVSTRGSGLAKTIAGGERLLRTKGGFRQLERAGLIEKGTTQTAEQILDTAAGWEKRAVMARDKLFKAAEKAGIDPKQADDLESAVNHQVIQHLEGRVQAPEQLQPFLDEYHDVMKGYGEARQAAGLPGPAPLPKPARGIMPAAKGRRESRLQAELAQAFGGRSENRDAYVAQIEAIPDHVVSRADKDGHLTMMDVISAHRTRAGEIAHPDDFYGQLGDVQYLDRVGLKGAKAGRLNQTLPDMPYSEAIREAIRERDAQALANWYFEVGPAVTEGLAGRMIRLRTREGEIVERPLAHLFADLFAVTSQNASPINNWGDAHGFLARILEYFRTHTDDELADAIDEVAHVPPGRTFGSAQVAKGEAGGPLGPALKFDPKTGAPVSPRGPYRATADVRASGIEDRGAIGSDLGDLFSGLGEKQVNALELLLGRGGEGGLRNWTVADLVDMAEKHGMTKVAANYFHDGSWRQMIPKHVVKAAGGNHERAALEYWGGEMLAKYKSYVDNIMDASTSDTVTLDTVMARILGEADTFFSTPGAWHEQAQIIRKLAQDPTLRAAVNGGRELRPHQIQALLWGWAKRHIQRTDVARLDSVTEPGLAAIAAGKMPDPTPYWEPYLNPERWATVDGAPKATEPVRTAFEDMAGGERGWTYLPSSAKKPYVELEKEWRKVGPRIKGLLRTRREADREAAADLWEAFWRRRRASFETTDVEKTATGARRMVTRPRAPDDSVASLRARSVKALEGGPDRGKVFAENFKKLQDELALMVRAEEDDLARVAAEGDNVVFQAVPGTARRSTLGPRGPGVGDEWVPRRAPKTPAERARVAEDAQDAADRSARMAEAFARGEPEGAGYLFQRGGERVLGMTEIRDDGRQIVTLFKDANLGTLMHENAHVLRRMGIPEKDLAMVEAHYGVTGGGQGFARLTGKGDLGQLVQGGPYRAGDWTVEHEERFARDFETYLRTAKAPLPELEGAFANIKQALRELWERFKLTKTGDELDPNMKAMFDEWLSGGEVRPTLPDGSMVNDLAPLNGLGARALGTGTVTHGEFYPRFLTPEGAQEIGREAVDQIPKPSGAIGQTAQGGSGMARNLENRFADTTTIRTAEGAPVFDTNPLRAGARYIGFTERDLSTARVGDELQTLKDAAGHPLFPEWDEGLKHAGYTPFELRVRDPETGERTLRTLAVPKILEGDLKKVMHVVGNDAALEHYAKGFDKYMTLWKAYATVPLPFGLGFMLRNAQGNFFNGSYLLGTPIRSFKEAQSVQWKMFRGRREEGDILALLDDTVPKYLDGAGRRVVTERGAVQEMIDRNILDAGFYETDLGAQQAFDFLNPGNRPKGWGRANPLSPNFFPLERGRELNSMIEHNARIGAYLGQRSKGFSPGEAASLVQKYLFDYGDLSTVDRKIKKLSPFWTFLRKNTPLQLESMFKTPGKYVALDRFRDAMMEQSGPYDPQSMPQWMKDSMGIVLPKGASDISAAMGIGDKGEAAVWMPDLPVTAALDALQPIKYLAKIGQPGGLEDFARSLVNTVGIGGPAGVAKAGMELALGRETFSGRPFYPGEQISTPLMLKPLEALGLVGPKMDRSTSYLLEQAMPLMPKVRGLFPTDPADADKQMRRILGTITGQGIWPLGESTRRGEFLRRTSELDRSRTELQNAGVYLPDAKTTRKKNAETRPGFENPAWMK